MNGNDFKNLVTESPQISELIELINAEKNKISLKGSYGAFTSTFMESAIQKLGGNHLIILADKEEAAYFLNDMQSLTNQATNVLFFPHSYKKPYQFEAIDNANVVARAEVLAYINAKKNGIIIT